MTSTPVYHYVTNRPVKSWGADGDPMRSRMVSTIVNVSSRYYINEKKGRTKKKAKKKAGVSEAMTTCPICRVESRPVSPEHYEGKIFEALTEDNEAAKERWESFNAYLAGKSSSSGLHRP